MINRPIHVVGAGGIGVALAWSLCRAGCRCDGLWMPIRKRVEPRTARRFDCGRGTGQSRHRSRFLKTGCLPTDALVLLCTKTYNNAAVLAVLPETSRLVPVQNGFDPKLDQRNHAAEGIASFVSECLRDRPVTRITRPGDLHLGARRSVSAAEKNDLAELAHALSPGALFAVQSVDDVRPCKATKLMYYMPPSRLLRRRRVSTMVNC